MSNSEPKRYRSTTTGKTFTEDELLDDLERRGIARPVEKYDTAGETCRNDGCTDPVPENDRKSLNLGIQDGYCGLACLLEAEDDN